MTNKSHLGKLTEHDWPEDFDKNNGQYLCKCLQCEKQFIGHKRRHVCKKCSISNGLQQIIKEESAVRSGILPSDVKMTTRKAFICASCEGVYVDRKVTRCDCMPKVQKFVKGTVTYPAF